MSPGLEVGDVDRRRDGDTAQVGLVFPDPADGADTDGNEQEDHEMTSWTAQTVCTVTGLSPDDVAGLAVDLDAGIIYDAETGRLMATFDVQAGSLRLAVDIALRRSTAVLPGKPAQITARTTEQYVADTEHPVPVDLVGLGEAAALLGVSRTRVDQLCRDRSDFPAPLARPGSGPVWTRASLLAYKERARPLPPGRPRKNSAERAAAPSRAGGLRPR